MKHIRVVAPGVAAMICRQDPFSSRRGPGCATQARPRRPGAGRVVRCAADASPEIEVLTIDGNWHKGRLRLVTSERIVLDSVTADPA